MSLASLHTICLHRIYSFLQEGTWKSCITNPFSELSPYDVDELMKMTLLHPVEEPPKMGDVILLLTSGRLKYIDLSPFKPERERDLIAKVTETRACSILMRNFTSHSTEDFIFHLVRNIVSVNPYLEEFHSPFHPEFDVFSNTKNLQILKLYNSRFTRTRISNFPVNFSLLSSLRNLEVLHLPYRDDKTIAQILEICPKLISIGYIDSLDSIEEVHKRRQRNPLSNGAIDNHLQLRRCVWGDDSISDNPEERPACVSRYCEKIRLAVALCPLMEELIFCGYVKEALNELRFLQQLTLLRIDFDEYKDDYVQEIVSLLQGIGPQLKHLSIFWKMPFEDNDGVPVDAICDYCSCLESLEIHFLMFEPRFSSGTAVNLPFKRLTLMFLDEGSESLLLLLSKCKDLEELHLSDVECFDDAFLSRLFQRNPLTELKYVIAEDCNLTREGYQMLLERAPSIETILIHSDFENYFYDSNRVFRDPNIRYLEDDYVYAKLRDFFHCQLDSNRF